MARQGKLDASVQEIEQAVRLEPTNARYRNNAAVVLVSMQQDQRALQHLSAVHGGAEANYNMGQLLVQRNRPMDAAPYFSAALEMNPSMQPAYEALSKLQGPGMGQVPSVAEQPMPVAPQQPVSADPQQATPTGPQMSFPATARNPAWGTSSYVPPGYYAPTQMQPQAVPYVGQAQPRHLPPVQGQQPQQSGAMRR
jgi:tetratricopeptide (TPR) repeat protein